MARRPLLALAVAAAAFLPAAAARAGWTPVEIVPGAKSATMPAPVIAVGGPGRVAVGWIDNGGAAAGASHPMLAVRVAVQRADGRYVVHTLARGRDLAAHGLTAAMDARGELTVAWIDALPGGHRTVRAAYRTIGGHWSRVQAIGFSSAFYYAVPRLAVAADGRVLLSYVAGVSRALGVGVAWRRSGHPFGVLRGVGRLRLFDPVPAFDPAGRAYLSGIADCDDESASRGVVRLTAPGGQRFGPPITVAPAPATELRLRVTAPGNAVAAWVGAGCSTSELLAGSIHVATLTGSTVGASQLVYAPPGRGLVLAGAGSAGAEANWTAFPPESPGGAVLAATMRGGSAFGPAGLPAGAWAAMSADAAGDQIVVARKPENYGPPDSVGARRAGADAVKVVALPGSGWVAAVGSGSGARSALAVARFVGGAIRIATWAPSP